MKYMVSGEISTASIFVLFYAILFGGVLRRLGAWSAFWRNDLAEPNGRWVRRVLLSVAIFNVLPAIYFGIGLYLLRGRLPPSDLWKLIFWSIGIFSSALFLPACYRLWVFGVIRLGLQPRQVPEIERYIKPGACNYFWGALPPFFASVGAILFLHLVF